MRGLADAKLLLCSPRSTILSKDRRKNTASLSQMPQSSELFRGVVVFDSPAVLYLWCACCGPSCVVVTVRASRSVLSGSSLCPPAAFVSIFNTQHCRTASVPQGRRTRTRHCGCRPVLSHGALNDCDLHGLLHCNWPWNPKHHSPFAMRCSVAPDTRLVNSAWKCAPLTSTQC